MIIEPGVYRRFPYRVAEENANEKKKWREKVRVSI